MPSNLSADLSAPFTIFYGDRERVSIASGALSNLPRAAMIERFRSHFSSGCRTSESLLHHWQCAIGIGCAIQNSLHPFECPRDMIPPDHLRLVHVRQLRQLPCRQTIYHSSSSLRCGLTTHLADPCALAPRRLQHGNAPSTTPTLHGTFPINLCCFCTSASTPSSSRYSQLASTRSSLSCRCSNTSGTQATAMRIGRPCGMQES